ncbi:MAG: ubiquinol-cytochrome c reductase iron-sulfur subunit [Dongiaceae bacterium]
MGHGGTAGHGAGEHGASGHGAGGTSRRDFLFLATGAVGGIGLVSVAWPFIDQMNPAADVLALSSTEVDLAPIEVGQRVTVTWRGKPVFIDHRPPDEIKAAEDVPLADLPDPQADKDRVQKPEWLIVIGICTHLGCVPGGQRLGEARGDYGGWLCPCHGSQYDTSGRIRRGPAPLNLAVPTYAFIKDNVVRIG